MEMTFSVPKDSDPNTATLDMLLRHELAAAATYEAAIDHVASPRVRMALEKNRLSHVARATTLGTMVRRRGREPSQKAGPWLALSRLVEAGASLFGDDATTKVLLEGERVVMNQITRAYDVLPIEPRDVVAGVILAEQAVCIERLESFASASAVT